MKSRNAGKIFLIVILLVLVVGGAIGFFKRDVLFEKERIAAVINKIKLSKIFTRKDKIRSIFYDK